jgi:hAT family C-terminal dimerisation region
VTLQAERSEDDNIILQTVATGLAACDESAYPLIHILLTILLTLPVSTTSAERSFSTLRRPKTLMRSRMGEERLTGLAMLNVQRDITVSVDSVIDRFAKS